MVQRIAYVLGVGLLGLDGGTGFIVTSLGKGCWEQETGGMPPLPALTTIIAGGTHETLTRRGDFRDMLDALWTALQIGVGLVVLVALAIVAVFFLRILLSLVKGLGKD